MMKEEEAMIVFMIFETIIQAETLMINSKSHLNSTCTMIPFTLLTEFVTHGDATQSDVKRNDFDNIVMSNAILILW